MKYGCSLSCLLLALTFVSAVAKQKARTETQFWLDVFENCPSKKNRPLHFNESGVETVGRTSMGYGTLISLEEVKVVDKMIITMRRCKTKNDLCEPFSTWRFGAEACSMMFLKNVFWEPMVQYHPPLPCPFKKGVYRIRNATVDVEAMVKINFPIQGYWKVTTTTFSAEKEMFCMLNEGMFARVKV